MSGEQVRWSAGNPGNVAIRAEVEAALAEATAGQLAGDGPILDLACGTGWWLERLARRGVAPSRLHGIELSGERVAAARARAPGATVVQGDARELPWEDGTFATVYLLLVLSSVGDGAAVRAVLREARRVVRPGGVVAVWEPRAPTPWNPRTRWIRRSELRSVLGPEASSRTLTVLPPLARRVGAGAYAWLGRVPALRTHRLAVFRPDGPRPRALAVVRNGVTHDARVHREVDALAAAGFAPVVIGVTTERDTARRDAAAGAPVIRLSPRSPARRLRDRLRHARPAPPRPARAGGAATPPASAARRLHVVATTADFHRQAIGAVRALRPALVHCNDWNTMWAGVAARLLGAGVVYDAHELWPDRNGRREWRPWLLAAEALFVRAADRVVTTSPGYARLLAARYRVQEPVIVRNVPTVRGAGPRSLGHPPVLAYAGGLLRGRGLEQAIDALAHIPEVRLELIGPGAPAYRDELMARAAERGVADRVAMPGPVPPDALVGALTPADAGLCLIQPVCLSYELTLPNKLYEYAAAGLPVLAGDLPVIAATVREHDAGEIVPPDDVEAIAAGLRRLLEPERHAACAAGARALAASAPWEGERTRLIRVYEDVT